MRRLNAVVTIEETDEDVESILTRLYGEDRIAVYIYPHLPDVQYNVVEMLVLSADQACGGAVMLPYH